jgi:glycosyltransferase involved in cell wall biosynthesis
VSTYPPRHCGLASYTADLRAALHEAGPDLDTVVVAVDRDGLRYGTEVATVIGQHDQASYRAAAQALARAGTRAVLVEHEYGIFGGPDGDHVLALADALTAYGVPYLVTLHTVLSTPTVHQLAVLRQLCAGATRVTVFTETARQIAGRTALASIDKVVVVPHGAPLALLTATDPQPLRPELADLDGSHSVITTFGLISAGKGIDTAIEALAAVVAHHPDVRYVVAGQTHPEVVRHDGEAYRSHLTATVRQLGLAAHVIFVDAFLTVEELGALLRRTTIVLTPYRSAEQTCSGVLTFALAAGRPVVSTAYRYAEDMLATGAGSLVPCGDASAMAAALDHLLTDRNALETVQARAWAVGSRLSWPAVAAQVADLVRTVVAEQLAAPALDLRHLLRLTDDIGILQFARGAAPDPTSGYCVDDVARLGIVAAQLAALNQAPEQADRWLRIALRFLAAARRDGAAMHNLLQKDGTWTDQPHAGDHVGRAVWAAGTIAANTAVAADVREQAATLLDDLAPLAAALPAAGARASAYAALGLVQHRRHWPTLATLVDSLDAAWLAVANAGWCWPEDRLTYDNARLVQAMLVGSAVLGRPQTAARALVSLDWYLAEVGLDAGMLRCVGNRWRHRDEIADRDAHDDGDEQPIDAAGLVETLLSARQQTGDNRYGALAVRTYSWFLGRNRRGVWLYDPHTGGCHDGVTAHGVNRNQGAESTLAYHQALLALVSAGLVHLTPPDRRIHPAPLATARSTDRNRRPRPTSKPRPQHS